MLKSNLINIPHAFSTREESSQDITKNLGAKKLITAKQIHSNIAHFIDDASFPHMRESIESNMLEGDALVTNIPNMAVGVYTADCGPILFSDEKARLVAAAHAGWKGARYGIIENTIKLMKDKGAKNITAVLGPCIHQKSYEVSAEFLDNFLDETKDNMRFFVEGFYNNVIPSEVEGSHLIKKDFSTPLCSAQNDKSSKYLFNLPAYIENKLVTSGIKNIEILDEDTLSKPNKFCSFRRGTLAGTKETGRQISAICLK